MFYIGADLGTTGLKMILMDENGEIKRSHSESYPISYPQSGWAEQDPQDWAEALKKGLKVLTEGIAADRIRAIGLDGQMHGLVMLDADDEVIRPAILWNDTRAAREVDHLNTEIGQDVIASYTGNIAFAGFTAPKILWVKRHEPENFSKIKKIMLPKDYLNYLLTGNLSTDVSDASGMLLLDVEKKTWSKEMLSLCSITEDMLPTLYESYEIVGTVREGLAGELGLTKETKVIAGAGDNAAAAVGAGTVGNEKCNISIGTSGTVFVTSDEFREGRNNAVHNFAHSDGKYHFLGCMLAAASANDWWMRILEAEDLELEQAGIQDLKSSRILFLPYLLGERSPHNDGNARGAFIGLSMTTTRRDMDQAVLEGVIFGLRDSLEVIRETGIDIRYSTLVGGGAKSSVWQNMVANILDIEVGILANEEGPALGSAILAAVGDGQYPDVETACQAIVKIKKVIRPDPATKAHFDRLYEIYKAGYPALKELNDQLAGL